MKSLWRGIVLSFLLCPAALAETPPVVNPLPTPEPPRLPGFVDTFGTLIEFVFPSAVFVAMGAYFFYRSLRPAALPHHGRFMAAVAFVPYLAVIGIPAAMKILFGNTDRAAADLALYSAGMFALAWGACCVFGYAVYLLVMQVPEKFRNLVTFFIWILLPLPFILFWFVLVPLTALEH